MSRRLALLGTLAALAFGLVAAWWPRPSVEPELSPPVSQASGNPWATSSLEAHPPGLALDGRSRSTRSLDGQSSSLPFAWKPGANDPEARWRWYWPDALPLRGLYVRARSEGSPSLRLNDTAVPLQGDDLDWLWWADKPHLTRDVAVGDVNSLARVELLFGDAPVVLLDGEQPDDWLAEVLHGHGVRPLNRLPVRWWKRALGLLAPGGSVVLANAELDDGVRTGLRAHVRAGGRVLETGPRSGVCGEPSEEASRFVGPVLGASAGLRFNGGLAPHTACQGCEPPVERLRTADGRVLLVEQSMGQGTCTRWLGDVAAAVRRLRQGRATLAGKDHNQREGTQPQDLFFGEIRPRDFASRAADMLVESVLAALRLPYRVHMLPAGLPGLLVMTADQDYAPDAALLLQSQDGAPPGLTFLLTTTRAGAAPDADFGKDAVEQLSSATAATLRSRGHDLGVHPSLVGLKADRATHAPVYRAHAEAFAAEYGYRPRVVRNHHLVWLGYTTTAEQQAAVGLRMNLDYMALAFINEGQLGYLNGSGWPLRFATPEGAVLPIHQQGTQLDDHVLLSPKFGYLPYRPDDLIALSGALMDRIARADPHPLVINHHPVWWNETRGKWQRALVEQAKQRGWAIWGAGQWLEHVERVRATLVVPGPAGAIKLLAPNQPKSVALLSPSDGDCAQPRKLAGQRWCPRPAVTRHALLQPTPL